jgi:predicted ATPase
MITQIRVKNFKSLQDLSLTLGRRNVLVGPNMAGKSNLISIFRFLNHIVLGSPATYGLPAAINREGGFAELAWRGAQSNLISISLAGDLTGFAAGTHDDKWQYSLDIVGDRLHGSITVQDEMLSFSSPAGDTVLIRRDPSTGRRILGSPTRGTITEISDINRSALEFEVPDWEGNRLRMLFASLRFYRLIPQLMKQANPASAPPFLEEVGQNLSSWLLMLQTRYPDSFARISSAVKDVLPDVGNLFTWPTPQSTVFIASSERFLQTPVPVWHMSDGQLCFIAFLSLIFSPEEFGSPLYCVEEPENHLHPKLIHSLLELLDQRQRELGHQAAQIITTTHSLQVVDSFNLDDVIVVEKREGATVCTRPGDKPHLRELLTREEVGLGDLFYSGALSDEQ